jgi:hypothetical protein
MHIPFSRCISFFLLSCLITTLTIIPTFELENNIIEQSIDTKYVYFDKNHREVILQLHEGNENIDLPLYALCDHFKRGLYIAEYDAVVEALIAATEVLRNDERNNSTRSKNLACDLSMLLNQVLAGELTVEIVENKNAIPAKTIILPSSLQIFDIGENFTAEGSQRLVAKTPALVVSIANETLSGLSTIDGVSLSTNDRVLLTGQTNAIDNGLWQAQAGSWTRPADFNIGDIADQAYVLITSGLVNAGSSWLCTTPTAVIGTDPITFVLFSYPDVILGANVGAGTGLIFRDKTGTTLNFKSLIAGTNIIISNNTDDITLSVNSDSNNTPNTLIQRDASGRFSAGAVSLTDEVISNSLTISSFGSAGILHSNASGAISNSLIVNSDIAVGTIGNDKLATILTAGKVLNAATTANPANLANAIVSRDSLGNFAASTITANLNGNATSATTATTSSTTTDFTGSLSGDVTGTQTATVVSFVGGQAASLVASGVSLSNGSTSNNTANTIIRRNASGNFSAGAISITDAVISNSIKITPMTTAGILHNSSLGVLSSSLIVNADIATTAAIADSKLATITTAGKVANSATTATALNNPSTIVARDASGNINATTVIANLLGTASNNLLKAGDTMTGTLIVPAGTAAAPSLTFTGSTTAGFSTTSGNLLFSTNGLERMRIASGGAISIKAFTAAGVVKNDASGNLSSSLIVDSNIASGAGIIDSKLATISSPGKITNSATTATDLNLANTIVSRDVSGNFSANQIEVVNLVVDGNLILSTDPATSSAGNIFKGVNTPFVHNFGTNNTFVGINAGNLTMSGNGRNAVFGANTFSSNLSGDNNSVLGYAALPACSTGTNNIAIGSGAGDVLTTGTNNIYINANASSSNESNTTRIGNLQTSCFIAGIRGVTTSNANAISVMIDSSGQLGTVSSSQTVKHDIEDMANASSDILNVRPVTFVYNGDETHTRQYGLIAEEVDQIFPEIVIKNEQGQPETIQYHVLPVLLLNEMKKQQLTMNEMQEIIAHLEARLERFMERLEAVENRA